MALFFNLQEPSLKDKAGQLYGAAMAQARRPEFYARLGVDDTPDGRLAMISLHILPILVRLAKAGEGQHGAGDLLRDDALVAGPNKDTPERRLNRLIMEAFVADLDQAMRELGIGDMGVPKRVKGAVAGFYDFARKYLQECKVDETGTEVQNLLGERVPGIGHQKKETQCLAHYLAATHKHLEQIDVTDLLAGRITFVRIEDHLD